MSKKTKSYSASVSDPERRAGRFTITRDYSSKAEFIRDIRGNGFKVNPMRVLETELFNFVIMHTNCEPSDWQEAARGTKK